MCVLGGHLHVIQTVSTFHVKRKGDGQIKVIESI